MARGRTLLRIGLLAGALCLAPSLASAAAHGWTGVAASLEPGIATVDSRDKQLLKLRLDAGTKVFPAQLEGQVLVFRRLATKVHFPQSWRILAQQWQENGTALVLPIRRTGGAVVAQILWEDERNPVKAGDRADLCRVPPDEVRPIILSLQCIPRWGAPAEKPAVAPGQEVWLKADLLCPTQEELKCEWTADAGEFVQAGGQPAGKTLEGPAMVRWRAPVARPSGPDAAATIRLKVQAGWRAQDAEQALTIRIAEPAGAYREVQWIPSHAVDAAGKNLGPLFADARLIAAGPLDSLYLADGTNGRLLHWGGGGSPRYIPLESGQALSLESFEGAAYLVQGAALLRLPPGAERPLKAADLPRTQRFAGFGLNAAGDPYVLDSGASPRLVFMAGDAWREAPLEPAVDSPWLTHLAIDPATSDAYVLDGRDKMVRQWRSLDGASRRLVDTPISIAKAMAQFGDPVAVLAWPNCNRIRDLPVRVAFSSGAVTEGWTCEGEPPKWEPNVARACRELVGFQFTAQSAAALPGGDLLLGGKGKVADEETAIVAQVSPSGEFRRMLPFPATAPRCIATASTGLRYVLLEKSRSQRLVLLGPDGWVAQDLGDLELYKPVVRLRPDRASPTNVFMIGQKRSRESAFRFDATEPARTLEMSSSGIPGQSIPEHRAVDVASSPEHIVILDRDGAVLVLANQKQVRFLGQFDTELRRPAAIAVFSNLTRRSAPTADRKSYVCVLPSGRSATSVDVWELQAAAGGKVKAVKVGMFPDPKRFPAEVQLSSPLAMDTGSADHPELLYVLDRGGTQVRVFDVAEIAFRLSQQGIPEIGADPLIGKLQFRGEALDLSVGPGQVVHVVDTEGGIIHSYARQP